MAYHLHEGFDGKGIMLGGDGKLLTHAVALAVFIHDP